MKDYVKAGAGFLVALAIIAAFTYWVGWGQIVYGLTHAQLRYAVPAAIIAFVGIVLLGVSWWIAVRDVINMNVLEGVKLFFVTFFANSVTPLGQFGGEPFIAYIVSRDADIPMEESLGAIIIADLINALPFFTLSLAGILVFLAFFPLNSVVALLLKIIVSLAVVLVTTIVLVAANQHWALRLLGGLGNNIDTVTATLGLSSLGLLNEVDREAMVQKGEAFFAILHTLLQKKRMLLTASTVAHVQALLTPVALYLFLLSLDTLHPTVDVPFSALLFIVPASMLAGYLPLPGGLGGIEVAMTALLVTIADIPAAPASAAVLLLRVCTYWAGLLIGGYFASHMSVDVFSNQYST